MMARDYQAEIDAARDRATEDAKAAAAIARNYERSRAAQKAAEKARMKREADREAARRKALAAMENWNAESAPDGMMAMPVEDLMNRMEALERDFKSLPEADGAFARFEVGQDALNRARWTWRALIGFGTDSPDPAKDNAIRLFMAQRTGVVLERPLERWLAWDVACETWNDGESRAGLAGASMTFVVVHREWGSWTPEAD